MEVEIAEDLKTFQTHLLEDEQYGSFLMRGDMMTIAKCLRFGILTGDALRFGQTNLALKDAQGALLTVVLFDRRGVAPFINNINNALEPFKWTLVGDRGPLDLFFNEYYFRETHLQSVHIRVLIMKNIHEFTIFLDKVECMDSQLFCDFSGWAYQKQHWNLMAESEPPDVCAGVQLNQRAFDFPNITGDQWQRAMASIKCSRVRSRPRRWFDFFSSISRQALFNATLVDFNPTFIKTHTLNHVPMAISPLVTGKHVWLSQGAIVATFEPLVAELERIELLASPAAVEMTDEQKATEVTFGLTAEFKVEAVAARSHAEDPFVIFSEQGQALSFGLPFVQQLAWVASFEDRFIALDRAARKNFKLGEFLPLTFTHAGQMLRGFLSGCCRVWQFQDAKIVPLKSLPPQNITAFEFIPQRQVFSDLVYDQAIACKANISVAQFEPPFPELRQHHWATQRVHDERPKIPRHRVTAAKMESIKAGTCYSLTSPNEAVNVQAALADPDEETILITDGHGANCVPKAYLEAILSQTTSLRVKCADVRKKGRFTTYDHYAQEDMVVAKILNLSGSDDWVPVRDIQNCLAKKYEALLLLKTTAQYERTSSVNRILDPENRRDEHGGSGGAAVACQEDTQITISRLIPWE